MENEEWRENVTFIEGSTSLRYLYPYDNVAQKFQLIIEVTNSDSKRTYDPYNFIDLLIFSKGEKAEAIKNISKSIKEFNELKSFIVHQIQAIKQSLEKAHPNTKQYDFSGKIMQIDSFIDIVKSKKDIKDKRAKAISFVITSLIALSGIVSAFILHYNDVKHENDRAVQIQLQIKELQSKLKETK